MTQLTHFDDKGQAHMVNVGDKPTTERVAVAEGWIRMAPATLEMILSGSAKKGDVLGVARIAGIMAAKRTADLIPLCHPISLTQASIELTPRVDAQAVYGRATVKTRGSTGVEMEALLAVQTALLTIYDMCKATDRGMVITEVKLLEKHGGKSGSWMAAQ